MKKLLALLLAVCMLLCFAACDSGNDDDKDDDKKATRAPVTEPQETEPEETLPPLGTDVGSLCYGTELPIVTKDGDTGETIDPTQTGKVTVINFWGTWCGPCVSEMPHLEELAEHYSETVTVIGVHSLEGYKQMTGFLAQNFADSPIVFSWETTGKFNGDYYNLVGGQGYYPYTVVLDARGVITAKKDGMMDYAEMVSLVEAAGAQENEPIAPVEIPQASVSDAYSYSFQYTNENWSTPGYITYCYHIPQVNLPEDRAAEINQTIYDTFYPTVDQVENHADEYDHPCAGIVYEMYQYEDVICLVIQSTINTNDLLNYEVYYLSASTGKALTVEQGYAAVGTTTDQAEALLTALMQEYSQQWTVSEYLTQDFIDSMTADTLAYISEAKPFISNSGKLMFTVKLATPAGAGWSRCIMDEDGQMSSISCPLPEHKHVNF